jgi:serine/threonine protein kinase
MARRHIGTIRFCAPELFLGAPYTEKVDAYSFGVILSEMVS